MKISQKYPSLERCEEGDLSFELWRACHFWASRYGCVIFGMQVWDPTAIEKNMHFRYDTWKVLEKEWFLF